MRVMPLTFANIGEIKTIKKIGGKGEVKKVILDRELLVYDR